MSPLGADAARHVRGTILGAAILGAVLAVAVAVALAVGDGRPGWPRAVAFAAVLAGSGSFAGWWTARRAANHPSGAVGLALAASTLRLVPPLAGLAWGVAAGRNTDRFDFGGLLVGFYLLLLATAIFLEIIGKAFCPRPRPGRAADCATDVPPI